MKAPVKSPGEPKPRGRPRSAASKLAILTAARELLEAGGLGAVTMEAVAARARVGKPTVYRWWPDRHAVAMAALMESDATPALASKRRAALAALKDQLSSIARRFATSSGRHVTSLIAASDSDSELSKAFRNHFVLERRSEGKALLLRALEQHELRTDLNVEVALDLLYGALFFRLLIGHAPVDEHFVDQALSEALRGLQA